MSSAFEHALGAVPDGAWFAPGRINLIGEHTDYNDGFVLPAALQLGATACLGRRDDDRVRMHAVDLGETLEVAIEEISAQAHLGWAAYVAGVGWAASRRGLAVPGIDIAVSSDVPLGAGLSSSAALSCVTAQAWNDLAGWGLSGPDIADLGRAAENHIAGAPTGVMDQLASVCGRTGHALQIDTRSIEITHVPVDLDSAGLSILVLDSNTPHTHADGAYADRRGACHAAAEALGVSALRDVPVTDLEHRIAALPEQLRRRARHVISDSDRVLRVAELLCGGDDPRRIGPLLNESHVSMRDDFEITVPTVDTLQAAALAAGAYGARMTGGGFGGCVIALIDRDAASATAAACARAAAAGGHPRPDAFIARLGEGARALA